MLSIEPSGAQYPSPIWIFDVKADAATPRGVLELHFWHADYPAGVQSKVYSLKPLQHESGYLLAKPADKESRGRLC